MQVTSYQNKVALVNACLVLKQGTEGFIFACSNKIYAQLIRSVNEPYSSSKVVKG